MTEKIIIIIRESVRESWLIDAGTFAMLVSSIGIGVLIDSYVLQWIAGFISILAIFSRAMNKSKRLTIDEARILLDSMKGRSEADNA